VRSKVQMEKKWRAIYVSSRAEKKVMEKLRARGINAYVPLVKSMRQWSDRKKMVEMPLLNGYAFVQISDSENETVLCEKGVVSFVKSEGKIATVRDEEILRLRQLVELGYHLDAYASTREVHKGEKVKIGSGPLRGLEGIIEDDKDQQHLCLLLESIGHCIRVRLPREILNYA
jgi:transcriptional antiterminator RfaH